MMAFTTRQREILKVILDVKRPIGSVELAKRLHITPRQVNYSMKGVRVWLKQHDQDLSVLPGVGFAVNLTPDQSHRLYRKISAQTEVQIVLSVSQRQQLLALFLLTRTEPSILAQLEQISQVSRMTILKDLGEIGAWLEARRVSLIRRPHFGLQVSGTEHDCQQALAELLWGETPFSSDPITEITHAEGLRFNLQGDVQLLPLVKHINDFLSSLHIRRTIGVVAQAEEQLGGRFTDDAVLHLALVFAIMSNLVQSGKHLEVDEAVLASLQSAKMWPVATQAAGRLARESHAIWMPGDIAGAAMEMMAAPRNEVFPGELQRDSDFSALSERLMAYISEALGIAKVRHDRMLQNGLLNNIVPACYRQRFNLWFPVALNSTGLPDKYEREHVVAQAVSQIVYESNGVQLPQSEINNLVVLLRAAYIRNRPYRFDHVIVICPSGMATAQLLVARLHVRFPNLSNLEVISLRDLTAAQVASADLILSTVPLPRQYSSSPKVIPVHPLLTAEDIENITQFLS